MEWEVVYYSEDVQRAIMAFPAGIQARYIHLTQRMLAFGPDPGMPHSRAMGQGLFELRLKSKEGIGRVCSSASFRASGQANIAEHLAVTAEGAPEVVRILEAATWST